MEFRTDELAIGDVLDKYYSWLNSLMGPKGLDKVALFSTITTHDIIKKAPMYTNEVFRSFVDRTLAISPEDFGPGNTTDRYSRRYKDLINVAGYELINNTKLTAEQSAAIDKADTNIGDAAKEIQAIRSKYASGWAVYAKKLKLKPGTPDYDLEKASYYAPGYSLIKIQREKIVSGESARKAARMSSYAQDRDAAQLCEVFERCNSSASLQNLPSTPDVEQVYKLDPIKIGTAAQLGLFPFEEELGIEPSQALTAILDAGGRREFSTATTTEVTRRHDSDWHGGGGGSWLSVFKVGGSASSDEHLRSTLKNIEEIKISCEYLTECWAKRRDWFDASIFSNKYVQRELKRHPDKAAQLALCISSAIVVRGLKVTYRFKNLSDVETWENWEAHGGGGFNVFGFSFGGSGGSSGNSKSHEVDKDYRTVTFRDGDKTCRLLALRATTVIPDVPQTLIEFSSKPLEESAIGQELIEAWKSGSIPYGLQFPEALNILLAKPLDTLKNQGD